MDFTETELKSDVLVAEIDPQLVHRARTEPGKSVF